MSIGSELAAARERAGLSIEELSAATRIRAGLLTAMEDDDFSRCGGNFYARGHLRSIARALQTDPDPLLAAFDQAHPVAEAGQSHADDLPDTRGPRLHPVRPRWAVVVGAILIGLMGWGMVRLFTLPRDVEASASSSTPTPAVTTPAPRSSPAPSRPRPVAPTTPKAAPRVVITVKAIKGGTYVTLRNYDGDKLFQGLLGTGSTQTVVHPGTVRVSVGDPAKVTITVNRAKVTSVSSRFVVAPDGTVRPSSPDA